MGGKGGGRGKITRELMLWKSNRAGGHPALKKVQLHKADEDEQGGGVTHLASLMARNILALHP